MSEEEKENVENEEINEEEKKEEEPVLDEQEKKDLEEDKAEEDRDREEEQVLDDEGNPIPNAPPKPPQNPLKLDMLKQNIKKFLKLLMAFLTLLLN